MERSMRPECPADDMRHQEGSICQEDEERNMKKARIHALEGQVTGVDLTALLPDECMWTVFSLLPGFRERSTCALVCMRWLTLQSLMRWEDPHEAAAIEAFRREAVKAGAQTPSFGHRSITGGEQKAGVEISKAPAMPGHLVRSLEGRHATDIRLASVAVGLVSRGGLGILEVKGCRQARGSVRVTNFGISAISMCCSGLTKLVLWECPYVDDEALVAVARGCSLLQKLDLLCCPRIGDRGMRAVAERCPQLAQLSVESCTALGSMGLMAVGQLSSKLVALAVTDCPLVGDKGLIAIGTGCRELKKLKLGGNLGLRDAGLRSLGEHCHGLLKLKLSNLPKLGADGMRALGESPGFQTLREMRVSACPGMTNETLKAIGSGCSELCSLSLTECREVGDTGVKALLEGSGHLESLSLDLCPAVNKSSLLSILGRFSGLQNLAICRCNGINDRGLASSLMSVACSSLRHLKLSSCMAIGSATLVALGQCSPRLETIDLSGLNCVTDRGVIALVEGCGETLLSLVLTGCSKVTDRSVSAVARFCGTKLSTLNLDGCTLVTDNGLAALAANCRTLEDLDLSRCSISDKGVKQIMAASGIRLKSLSLLGCQALTDVSLASISSCFDTLWGLNLKSCPGFSVEALRSLELSAISFSGPPCFFSDLN